MLQGVLHVRLRMSENRAKLSSGTVLYRFVDGAVEVLLVHPAGNYNRRAPWGIPKGAPDPDEDSRRRRDARRAKRPASRSTDRSSISDSSTTRDRKSACTDTPRRRLRGRHPAARRGKSTRPSSSRSAVLDGSFIPIRPRCSTVSCATSVRPTTTQVLKRPQPERSSSRT